MDNNMLREWLKEPKNWSSESPEKILNLVKQVGGWATVFREGVPFLAHRLRTYFNVEPIFLTRLDADFSRELLYPIERTTDALYRARKRKWLKAHHLFGTMPAVKKMPEPPPGTPDMSLGDDVGEAFALSGDVYRENLSNRIWYQMSPGGTIYHWGGEPVMPKLEALSQVGAQAIIPIFKLVSPDGTGGSCETIIKNEPNERMNIDGFWLKVGRFSIGEVNKSEHVSHLINTDPWHQGSYNYAETVQKGLAAHKRLDVEPHEKYPHKAIYLNPPNRFMALASRRFPKIVDNQAEAAAWQITRAF